MRKEIKQVSASLLIVFLLMLGIMSPALFAIGTDKEMTILFTHDLHDHFLPMKDQLNGVVGESGGYARLQSAILEEKKDDPEALLLDAGDFSMGTPFQTLYKSDSPALRILGHMGYDVVTFGNHEYDYRAGGLADSLMAAKNSGDKIPQIVQSNVIFPTDQAGKLTPSLTKLQQAYNEVGVKEYTVLEKKGVKIGIFGLMGEDAASKAPMSEVKFSDVVENAQRIVKILKEQEKADLIICLSHVGTSSDKDGSEDEILARKVPDINVILSGHTHTKLPEPVIVGNTIIGSVQDSAKYLGIMRINKGTDSTWTLDSYKLRSIDASLQDDPYIAGITAKYKQLVDEKYFKLFDLSFDEVLAVAPFNFATVDTIHDHLGEAPLGNLISDAYIYAVKKAEGQSYIPIDAAIVPVGTIRSSFFQGDITAADAFCASSLGIGPDNVPGYPLLSVYLTGKELKTVCEVDASVSPMMQDAQLYISGMKYTFNPNRIIFNKVTDTSLEKPDGSLAEIDDTKLYRVAAGLYSAQMLSVVGDKSFGLLSVVPKTKDGIPITDFEAQIIRDTASGSNTEVKEWHAIAQYLKSFAKVNGVPQIPQYYNELQGRKVIDDNKNIMAVISSPNKITLGIYGIAVLLIALVTLIVYKMAALRKRSRSLREKQPENI